MLPLPLVGARVAVEEEREPNGACVVGRGRRGPPSEEEEDPNTSALVSLDGKGAFPLPSGEASPTPLNQSF